jgi:hypothetical protein
MAVHAQHESQGMADHQQMKDCCKCCEEMMAKMHEGHPNHEEHKGN